MMRSNKKKSLIVFVFAVLLFNVSRYSYADTQFKNPNGTSSIPKEAQAEDVSNPDHIIGTGTPESCTAEAFIEAVAQGGKIVFNGGTEPFTITLDQPAQIFNNASPDVIIDGGGLVTLSGGGKTRILYMNTCDPDLVWTTNHCQDQATPRLTVQNITFANGNSTNEDVYTGGGAIWARGGRLKIVNCRFINNVCAATGPDVGGGAVRVFDQYQDLPVYVVNSTFGGGEALGNIGSNGGAISSIGVSWTIINSVFSYNEAIGDGGNPAKAGTVGGGSGGAIYNDGNQMTLSISGSRIEHNKVNAYGSGIFFVTNNHTGDIQLRDTVIENNIGGSWYPAIPNVSMHADTKVEIVNTPSKEAVSQEEASSVVPQAIEMELDGRNVLIEAYNIKGYNYFKLRDLAALMAETEKAFNVTWNEDLKAINVITGSVYKNTGGELSFTDTTKFYPYEKVEPKVLLDGNSIEMDAYRINGYTYFKLRDVAEVIDFEVGWSAIDNKTSIHTLQSYFDS